jgi:aerobic carbon-monoxide dehydrogenase large subunit
MVGPVRSVGGGDRLVGEPVPRREDARFLTGEGTFVDDISLPGMLHVVVVRSPLAHARINEVDLEAARDAPGVVAAFSGRELRAHWVAPLPMVWPVTDDIKVPEHWPLAVTEARHLGDGVAVVVAETRARAEDAAELVRLDLDPLPVAASIEAALAQGAPLVHPEFGTNRCYEVVYERGDVDEIFARAEVVVSRRLRQQRLIPSPLEGRGVIAQPFPARGELVLWSSTQVPHAVRASVAECLRMPHRSVRVIAPDVGGAFGAKLNVYAEEVLVPALARRLGRPVKWIEGRSEGYLITTHGRDHVQHIEIAATRQGLIRGIRATELAAMGAYLQFDAPGVPLLGQFLYCGAYRTEAYSFRCTGVFTNQTPVASYRGAGRPEAAYAIERAMDALAAEVGLDPVEVRRRNLLPAGEWVENGAGIPNDSVDYEPSLDAALDLAGYAKLRAEQAGRRERGARRQLGIGLSCYAESGGVGPSSLLGRVGFRLGGWEAARVRVLASGDVEVISGTSPQGQGHETAWSQLAGDVLGIPTGRVTVLSGDTAVAPMGTGAFGSRSLVVGGTAIHRAAGKVVEKARRIAAHLLEAAEEDVEFAGGRFAVTGAPEREVSIDEVAEAAHTGHDLPQGMEPGLDESVVHDPGGYTNPFGAHVAVVEVDTETGLVALIRYVAVDDCGTVLNPLIVDGQIHGGLAQGIAQALYEEAVYSEDGQLETGSLMTYLVPTAMELPRFELGRTVTPSPVNPLGAKGTGEAGTIGSPPAVINAVIDALGPLGVRHLDMPATPEHVWRAMVEARASPSDRR